MTKKDDKEYLQLLLKPIRICASYHPKFGQNEKNGLDLEAFQTLYRSDPFYSWFGLDNALMYAAHKAAGGMTSVYRQIGIACEALFRKVLQDRLKLSVSDSKWSYTTIGANNRKRRLSLDGRIPLSSLHDKSDHTRVRKWMRQACKLLGVDPSIALSLKGTVFEVRQGYKSKDAKRQNADIANAATAYTQGYMPCLVLLSTQIDSDIATRYRNEQWTILVGTITDSSPTSSTYAFMREVVGYDLAAFFKRNRKTLHKEVDSVLKKLLSPQT